jgi:hypothetical protein
MRYSYTRAQSKDLLFQDTKVWIIFLILTLAILFGFKSLVNLQISMVKRDIDMYEGRKAVLLRDINNTNYQLNKVKLQIDKYQKVINSNQALKNSIDNLFQLVPSQIT